MIGNGELDVPSKEGMIAANQTAKKATEPDLGQSPQPPLNQQEDHRQAQSKRMGATTDPDPQTRMDVIAEPPPAVGKEETPPQGPYMVGPPEPNFEVSHKQMYFAMSMDMST